MEYWRNAVENVTTWTILKFKILNTRKLNQDDLENTFGAISLRCGSNNNPSDAVKTSYTHFSAIQCFIKQSVNKP
jgi:hypothetical protein